MVKGFLLLESIFGLIISSLAIGLLAITLGQGKEVEKRVEIKVDKAVANHIKRATGITNVKIHNKNY